MTDRPQGPGWWQASDLKWYPPEQHANYVAPPSSPATPATPTPSPGTASRNAMTPPPQSGPPYSGPSRRTLWLVVAGVGALIAVILVVVGGQHPSQPAPGQPAAGQPAPSGHQSAAPQPGKHNPAGRSPNYQHGYEFGNQQMSILSGKFDCEFAAGRQWVARRDRPDWVQGCVDGLADMKAEPGAPTLPELPKICTDIRGC
jgi:hypothetical protein